VVKVTDGVGVSVSDVTAVGWLLGCMKARRNLHYGKQYTAGELV
jgi:hypothetical protein